MSKSQSNGIQLVPFSIALVSTAASCLPPTGGKKHPNLPFDLWDTLAVPVSYDTTFVFLASAFCSDEGPVHMIEKEDVNLIGSTEIVFHLNGKRYDEDKRIQITQQEKDDSILVRFYFSRTNEQADNSLGHIPLAKITTPPSFPSYVHIDSLQVKRPAGKHVAVFHGVEADSVSQAWW